MLHSGYFEPSSGNYHGVATASHGNTIYVVAIRNKGLDDQHVVVLSVELETHETKELSFEGVGDYTSAAGIYVGSTTDASQINPVVILTDYKY